MRPIAHTLAAFSVFGIAFFALGGCQLQQVDPTNSTSSGCFDLNLSERSGAEVGINELQFDGNEVAQSFKPTATLTVGAVSLRLAASYTVALAGKIYVRIVSDDSGDPSSSTALAQGEIYTSDVRKETDITQAKFYRVNLTTPVTVDPGKRYWIVVRADYPKSNTDLVKWLGNDSNPYADGTVKLRGSSSGATWQSSFPNTDLLFKLHCL